MITIGEMQATGFIATQYRKPLSLSLSFSLSLSLSLYTQLHNEYTNKKKKIIEQLSSKPHNNILT